MFFRPPSVWLAPEGRVLVSCGPAEGNLCLGPVLLDAKEACGKKCHFSPDALEPNESRPPCQCLLALFVQVDTLTGVFDVCTSPHNDTSRSMPGKRKSDQHEGLRAGHKHQTPLSIAQHGRSTIRVSRPLSHTQRLCCCRSRD